MRDLEQERLDERYAVEAQQNLAFLKSFILGLMVVIGVVGALM